MKRSHFHHALKVVEEKCFGCTHCMLTCPTEAIRVYGGKAHVDPDRCIDCGNCMSVCPADAIVIEQDDFEKIYNYAYRVAVLPSVMIGQFPDTVQEGQILSVLTGMGFNQVWEAESGIDLLKELSGDFANVSTYAEEKPLISSFCPAIVRLIQVRFPSLTGHLNLIKPPLDILATYLRNKLEADGISPRDIGIFYVTPCAAKIAAIKEPVGEKRSSFEGVINMDFLYNLVNRDMVKQKKLKSCALPATRAISPRAVLWSLTGGESAALPGRTLAVDGIHHVMEFLEKLENDEISGIDFLELRACDEGCAGGILGSGNRFLTAERLRHRAKQLNEPAPVQGPAITPAPASPMSPDLAASLRSSIKLDQIEPRSIMKLDDDVAKAMAKMDLMEEVLAELPGVDCGLCGSPGCEALAADIARGRADRQQCIFLQRRQESLDKHNVERGIRTMARIWGRDRVE